MTLLALKVADPWFSLFVFLLMSAVVMFYVAYNCIIEAKLSWKKEPCRLDNCYHWDKQGLNGSAGHVLI